MTDPILLGLEFFNAAGLVLLFFMSTFSNYIRPFVTESGRNFIGWLRGTWSIRTGKPIPIPEVKVRVEPLEE